MGESSKCSNLPPNHWAPAAAMAAAMALLVAAGAMAACPTAVWDGRANRRYSRCAELGSQGAVLAYSYSARSHVLDVAFTGKLPAAGGWVGWGINPAGWGMTGSSVLLAFRASNGSNLLPYKLTPASIQSRRPRCSAVDLPIRPGSLAVQIAGSGAVSIFASLQLQGSTSLNLVWNRGPSVHNFSPLPHTLQPQDVRGFAALDVST